jgi:hypothetical protein
MTLPSSGPLSIGQINAEFGRGNNLNAYRGSTYYIPGIPGSFTFPSGSISIFNFYGTSATNPVIPGNVTYNSPGNYNFIVPIYNTLIIQVWGGGGGGAYYSSGGYANGGPGGTSSATTSAGTITATGGQNGGNYGTNSSGVSYGGSGSGPSGTLTANGGNAYAVASYGTVYGGAGANGGAGASGDTYGQAPGGGGGGYVTASGGGNTRYVTGGGGGGWASYTFNSYIPQTISITVGAGGSASDGNNYGGNGQVYISWS